LGSLYETAAPAATGVLCTITVDCDVTQVCVTGNAIRGNVVLEDASEATLVLPACLAGPFCGGDVCFPSSHPDYDEWIAVGSPLSWCGERQCRGDADNDREGSNFFGWMYVGGNDLAALIDAWKVLDPPKGPGITIDQLRADFSHSREGSDFFGWMRVGGQDLNLLIANWKVLEDPKGPGTPPDCLDF
jgi:hypothetical protein